MDCNRCKSRKIEEDEIKPNGELYKTCKICRAINKKSMLKTLCLHNRVKKTCRECKGSGICEHNKRKSYCKECGGGSLCIHKREKSRCKECGGSQICEHNIQKSNCKECGGYQICEHNKLKQYCRECKGSGICEHNKRKTTCKYCSPLGHLIYLQRANIKRCLKLSSFKKELHSIEYLGCSVEDFVKYLQKKIDIYNMTNMTDMTLKNIHLDHIKPVSKFNLNDESILLECCNYTNFQPLFATDNLNKSNKWTDKDEEFWRTNIFNNPDYTDIYMPL